MGLGSFGCCLATDDFEDDEVVVALAPGVSIETINTRYGTYTREHEAVTADYLLGTSPGANLDALVASMALDVDLLYAEKNHTSEAAEGIQGTIASVDRTATQQSVRSQPSVMALRAAQAHATATGAGVLVAVVDNGVSPDHPEMIGHLSPLGFDFVDGDTSPWETANGIDNDGDGLVDEGFGHGTHVSGLVLLAAPDAIIVPVRVLDDEGRGPAYRVAQGIRFATRIGARVINLSLSTRTTSSIVGEAIHDARERGITIVAGAGNANAPSPDYPASDPDVIGVAGTDDSGVKSPFSNYGSAITISAPAHDVLSSYGSIDYAAWGGTSMASGFASGGAAILLGRYPELPSTEVALKLMATATSIESQNPSYHGQLGAGLLNLEGLSTVAAPSTGSLRMGKSSGSGAFASWQPVEGATAYDVIRGSIAFLSPAGANVYLGPVTCLANNTPATSTASSPDTASPPPGQGFFYLMRPVNGPVHPDYRDELGDFDRFPGPGDCPL